MDGAEGKQAADVRAFRDELAAIVDVPVETYDERLTTRLAESSARAGASAPADALAAAHLLDTYLLHLAGAGEGPASDGRLQRPIRRGAGGGGAPPAPR